MRMNNPYGFLDSDDESLEESIEQEASPEALDSVDHDELLLKIRSCI